MSRYEAVVRSLRESPRRWTVTGVAGFIGSNLLERLLRLGQTVVGIDDFSTGRPRNLEEVVAAVGHRLAANFTFLEGDVSDPEASRAACRGSDVVLHQAALGSVPRSIEDPLATNRANVDGFLTTLVAAHDAGVERFVYASSSSVYGDEPGLPKVEDRVGNPLSPYAASKRTDEIYAEAFQRSYGMRCIGLRYFNVFGPRQDPSGPYAAVIPRWIGELMAGEPCRIFGDGKTSRDFCYVENAVRANLLGATAPEDLEGHRVYNVACGERTTLDELFRLIRGGLAEHHPQVAGAEPVYDDFRPGDVRHSLADIGRIERELGYEVSHTVERGLEEALSWYVDHLRGIAGGESVAVRGGSA